MGGADGSKGLRRDPRHPPAERKQGLVSPLVLGEYLLLGQGWELG